MSCNIMPEVYAFDIGRTDKAADLHRINGEIMADETLAEYERTELVEAIKERFARLNHRAAPTPQPRWT